MKMEINEEYLNRGMDLKRLVLYLQKKAWLVIVLAIFGAVCGGIVYQVVRGVKMPVEYESVSKLYISFGNDENGETYQYYNGYTWNDLLDTDPILDIIMNALPGYERAEVREATTAEILSDIRLLTVTVRGDNEKFVREIRNAVESGLREYAKKSKELVQIETIRSGAPERVYWDDRTTAACVTGAVILGILSLLGVGVSYALDESVYVQEDVEKQYGCKALGILTRNQKGLQPYARELKANLHYLLGEKKSFVVLDMDNHGDMRRLELERLLGREDTDGFGSGMLTIKEEFSWNVSDEETLKEPESEWEILSFNENVFGEEECTKIREAGGVILLLPFGTDTGRKTSRILSLLKNQDCQVLGMIIAQADEEFLNRYFA